MTYTVDLDFDRQTYVVLNDWDNEVFADPSERECREWIEHQPTPINDCETVASLDQAGAYEFNTILFVRKDGEIRVTTDSGCSCPIPFEGNTWEDAQPVRTPEDVELAVARWWDRERSYGGVNVGECVRLKRRVIEALRGTAGK